MKDNISDNFLKDLPRDGYSRQSQLIPHIVPFSPATLWRKVRTGDFPKPIKLSKRVTAWKNSDVLEWLDNLHQAATAK